MVPSKFYRCYVCAKVSQICAKFMAQFLFKEGAFEYIALNMSKLNELC